MDLALQSLRIKETPALFSDYLYDFQKTSRFFRWNYRDDWENCAEIRLREYVHRDEMRKILLAQNKVWHATESTIRNIGKFGESNTLAIVTGQQAGLYGGPLYTTYKALTAIKLAESLSVRYPQWNFVPVFWMEVGDSDFAEVNHFHLLNPENELVRLGLDEQPRDFRSVYHRKITADIDGLQPRLTESCMASEFRDNILSELKNIYSPGKPFPDAFGEWLMHMFGDRGLVVVNPTDKRIAELSRPIFLRALNDWEVLGEKVDEVSDQLKEAGYHQQITLQDRQTFLFIESEDGGRCRIDAAAHGFHVRHPQQPYSISKDELQKILDNEAWRFTPNVALRPVLQDFLFPTLAYIAGPGEISYAAQLKQVYDFLQVTEPVFFPRCRITIVERKIQKLIGKFGLDYSTIFESRGNLMDDYIKANEDNKVSEAFGMAEKRLDDLIGHLDEVVSAVDQILKPAVTKTREQFFNSLKKLNDRTEQAVKRNLETEVSQLSKISANLFPAGDYQERVINHLHYLVKYGPEFVAALYKILPAWTIDHQLLFI
ncbi:MAG: bacillithiol biosynthesis cysteine-adding enzyme BshC [Calditrichia bacterium]